MTSEAERREFFEKCSQQCHTVEGKIRTKKSTGFGNGAIGHFICDNGNRNQMSIPCAPFLNSH